MAIAVTIVCACVTLLVLASAIYMAVVFAADHELGGSAWLAVACMTTFGLISGSATAYLGRRGVQDLQRAKMTSTADSA
ncbi:hypothetical protein SAMN04489832_6676 [Micromonospora cremea]|uniref:Uncharacterized protein n=2 Tax=Micromonospora cremea TaxID=709881 RepID=A0A1N6B4I2_9ACTN|nr:hypothetical protein SAMN04489832_6676 [Micromonospora cremea]